jgi:citrate synthase
VTKGRPDSWQGYWTTRIGWAEEGKILVRGYRAEELIRSLTFAEATYLVIRGELPTLAQGRALDAVLRSGLDQAFISSAVPPARFAASAAPEAPAAAIAAGVIAFGSVTGSPRECAEMLAAAHRERGRTRLSLAESAAAIVERHRREGRRIPGLGHPVHKRLEPRAAALRDIATGLGVWGERARLLDAIARAATRRLGRPLPENLAGVIAAVLLEIGFEPIEMVGLGVLSYLPALIAHTTEEIREGHPLRIIPPALGARYAGPAERRLPSRRADTPIRRSKEPRA